MVSRILLIISVTTFALAAPVLVGEKRQAPEDMMAVLGKRVLEGDLDALFEGWHYKNVFGDASLPPSLPRPAEAEVHVSPPNPAGAHAQQPNQAVEHVPELFTPPPNLPYVLVPEGHPPPRNLPFLRVVTLHRLTPPRNPVQINVVPVHMPPHPLADVGPVWMDIGGDAPPVSPEHGNSPPTSPRFPTRSEEWTD